MRAALGACLPQSAGLTLVLPLALAEEMLSPGCEDVTALH